MPSHPQHPLSDPGLVKLSSCTHAHKLFTSRPALQIAEGLAYFLDLAGTTRPKIVALVDAVTSGDLTEAKAAYVNSRAEYEQIEVLAPGFPDLDCRIDCRASAPHMHALPCPRQICTSRAPAQPINAQAMHISCMNPRALRAVLCAHPRRTCGICR